MKRLLLSLATLVLALGVLEAAVRGFEAVYGRPAADWLLWPAQRPPPYRDADYWSEEFLDELVSQPSPWKFDPATRLYWPPDSSGRYFNVAEGRRATAFQPEAFEHTIHLFGGSTVYCVEVPDEHTLASRIQTKLNALFPDRFRVENRGYSAVHQRQQIARLESTAVEPGDYVLFYDGFNDVWQTIFRGGPGRAIAFDQIGAVDAWGPAQRLVHGLYVGVGPYSRFVYRFVQRFSYQTPAHLRDEPRVRGLVARLERDFREGLIAASRLSDERGARFVHFLQPQLFEHGVRTDWENRILSVPRISRSGFERSFRLGYPALRRAMQSARGQGVPSFDLSGVLVDRAPGTEYYLDPAHVNHRANDRIAERIVEVLVTQLEREADAPGRYPQGAFELPGELRHRAAVRTLELSRVPRAALEEAPKAPCARADR